jgi:hypothetical protein
MEEMRRVKDRAATVLELTWPKARYRYHIKSRVLEETMPQLARTLGSY